uniref:Uncharacterized protein n=1 Tax=Nelumbo nucifera TaxID=4432 RepID=A0A822ZHV3_NELNU|nr:TPA_asm: hypothetical protein HUJ06_015591 [Nelumbo nucifera]
MHSSYIIRASSSSSKIRRKSSLTKSSSGFPSIVEFGGRLGSVELSLTAHLTFGSVSAFVTFGFPECLDGE